MKIDRLTLIAGLILLTLIACGSGSGSGSESLYDDIIANDAIPSGDATRGETLFNAPVAGAESAPGCRSCHVADAGVNIVGPSQVGLATLAAEGLNNPNYRGKAQSVEGYLWESVVSPNVNLAEGYAGVMYANYGVKLTEQEIADLVAFMKTLD